MWAKGLHAAASAATASSGTMVLTVSFMLFLGLIVRLSLTEPAEEWQSAAAVAEGGNDHQMAVLRHGEILDDHRINCGHGCV